MDFLKRITDLFTEGIEVYLGDDAGEPIVVWVNQLNSFETEDARIDGQMRRNERMAALANDESPEMAGVRAEIAVLNTDRVAERFVRQRQEEIMLDVYNDLETDPEFVALQERCIRLPDQLEADGAADDDPRRKQLAEDQNRWTKRIAEARDAAFAEALADAKELDREELVNAYIEKWRERATVDVFMVERRITEVWFAARECRAVDVGTDVKRKVWNHDACDHSVRLIPDRSSVRGLPENVLSKLGQAIDSVKVSPREAGNSDAPASSSDSSEPASVEAPSILSTPDETPVAPRMV